MLDVLYLINRKLDRILRLLQITEHEVNRMSVQTDQAMADLTEATARTQAGIQSAIVILNGIPALLEAQGIPAAQVAAVTETLKGGADALLAAVAAAGTQPAQPGPVIEEPAAV